MSRPSASACTVGALPLLLLLLLEAPAGDAISCFKTEFGQTPHKRDCGPLAKGCRVIVNPYTFKNDSAVSSCEYGTRLGGNYIYDCAIDCSADYQHWNEVDCCLGDDCNNGEALKKSKHCYVSKAKDASKDTIVKCSDPKKCALNKKTGDTDCVDADQCKDKGWWCCDDSCDDMASFGIYKPRVPVGADESTDANSLTASFALSIASFLTVRAVTAP